MYFYTSTTYKELMCFKSTFFYEKSNQMAQILFERNNLQQITKKQPRENSSFDL